jgi:predicted metal-dependent hydrolase
MMLFTRRPVIQTADTIEPIILPGGATLPVELRRSARASRIALRLHPSFASVELVVPQGTSVARAVAFLESRRGWIAAQAAKLPPRVDFRDGAVFPVLGRPHLLVGVGSGAGGRVPPFRIADGRVEVTGAPEHLARRTRTGLARQAAMLLRDKTQTLAATLDREVNQVTVGDAKTRWGNCASSGKIRYSWRLIFAPEPVMDYVVAHEVAHLVEMNHSLRFWRVVEQLRPGHAAERHWLKHHGAELLRYG